MQLTYDVVTPVYRRSSVLRFYLSGIASQSVKPKNVFLINNNTDRSESESLYKLIGDMNELGLAITILESPVNSGAIGRNLGASHSDADIIAFIDSDVVLKCDYAEKLLLTLEGDNSVVAIQGYDLSLTKRKNTGRIARLIEWFLQVSSIYDCKESCITPSLRVSHPVKGKEQLRESFWVSTCAGFFKRSLFTKISFDSQFLLYSWNEYLLFSLEIQNCGLGRMLYQMDSYYTNLPDSDGRQTNMTLSVMCHCHDWYIFLKAYKKSLSAWLIFLWSRIGSFVLFSFRDVRSSGKMHKIAFHLFAMFVPLWYLSDLKDSNMTRINRLFFEKQAQR